MKLLLRILSKIIKLDEDSITLIYKGYSGSNLSPIIEGLKENNNSYKVNIVLDHIDYNNYKKGDISKFEFYKKRLEKYRLVFRSKLVITTHGFYRLRNDNVMLNLWHGMPLKSMSLMNKSKEDAIGYIEDDYFLSTSEFFNTTMNSCIGIEADKYYIGGYPRNDYLFKENGKKNLKLLTKKANDKKIIMYMPTYRDLSTGKGSENNIFRFNEFDFKKFNNFLESNNLMFLLKLHPNEERQFLDAYKNYNSNNIFLIKGEDLEAEKMDFYKILNAADILITDYSSVYFDYLLLNRPILFTPTDFEEYKAHRGFLLEPYDFWAPGLKCGNQDELERNILASIKDPNMYKKERETIRDLIHKYQDAKSTDRVMDLINEIMK